LIHIKETFLLRYFEKELTNSLLFRKILLSATQQSEILIACSTVRISFLKWWKCEAPRSSGQPVRGQEPHHTSYCVTAKSHITKLTTLSLNLASYETRFLLHDIVQGFLAIVPGKLPACGVCSTSVHSSTVVSPLALTFLRLHLPGRAHTHTREHASRICDSLCYVLAQTTKRTSTQHSN